MSSAACRKSDASQSMSVKDLEAVQIASPRKRRVSGQVKLLCPRVVTSHDNRCERSRGQRGVAKNAADSTRARVQIARIATKQFIASESGKANFHFLGGKPADQIVGNDRRI